MRMDGYYLTSPKDDLQMAYPISSVIEFKIIPLNQTRTEIVAECIQPVCESYFQFLLEEINRRWSLIKTSEQQLLELREAVMSGFSELKQGQNTLMNIQEKLSQVLIDAIHDGQIEQGEMSRTLDAIRRALKYMQNQDTNLGKEVTEQIRKANEIVDSKFDLQQKIELTIPILPLFLNYKVEFGIANDVDMQNLYNEIQARLLFLMEKSSKNGGGYR